MLPYILIAFAAAIVILALFWKLSSPGNSRMLKQAVADNDIAPLVAEAEKLDGPRRSAFYQRVIKQLWEGWQRPLAVLLVREYARHHSDEKICQFWLKQVLEVEPDEAQRAFDDTFLKAHYQPEVANTCGVHSS